MFCPKCGQQIPDDSFFCPSCGAQLQFNSQPIPGDDPYAIPQPQRSFGTGFAATLREHLKSNLTLIICILFTVVAVFSFNFTYTTDFETGAVSASSNFNLFAILAAIACWITYANAKSSKEVMPVGGLKFASGIATAVNVVMWILIVCLVVVALLFFLAMPMFDSIISDPSMIGEFDIMMEELNLAFEEAGLGEFGITAQSFLDMIMIIIPIIFIITAVVLIIMNIFAYGKFRKFAAALHLSYMTDRVTNIKYKGVIGWLTAIGIIQIAGVLFSGVSAIIADPVMGTMALISSATEGIVLIVASVWVRQLSEKTESLQ